TDLHGRRLFYLLNENVIHVLADVLLEQRAVLVAHFVGRSFEMEHGIAFDQFQPSRAAPSHGLRREQRRPGERQDQPAEEDNPLQETRHGKFLGEKRSMRPLTILHAMNGWR